MSAAPATGIPFHIGRGAVSASIAPVGAALRAVTVDGVDLVPGYPDELPTPAACGVVLVPWPNRVRAGAWSQRDRSYQLALTEPQLGNASHGLLRFATYAADEVAPDSVTLRAPVVPQTGYPFHLDTRVTYRIAERGIEVRHEITNVGGEDAPVAVGTHPYLQISDVATADLTVEIDAATRYLLDDRKLPVGTAPVDAAHDLRTPRRVGDLDIDTAYADPVRDHEGRIHGLLRAPDGRTVDLWAGEGFTHLQAFTTDRFPGTPVAIAIEPMTAPADALNSGDGLRWLAPGESWRLVWGIDLVV
jgi:aldose 1-epimerase